ncbi:uncharacterized protein [Dysidea avara]|uniref:uncharacterized protein isoform X2 n=1 Tax=Dysidea avara TaxID=196820 RepID=UPI0033206C37
MSSSDCEYNQNTGDYGGDMCRESVPSTAYPQPAADAYPPPDPYPQSFTIQQVQDPNNSGLQAPQPYPTQDVNPPVLDPLPYPTQQYQPPPPAYDDQKGITQPQPVQAVVQQPRAAVVRGHPGVGGQSFLGCSFACLVLSALFFWPSLIFSIPAVILSGLSICSYNRGDYENGVKQGKWSLGLTGAAVLTFIVVVIVIIVIEVTVS